MPASVFLEITRTEHPRKPPASLIRELTMMETIQEVGTQSPYLRTLPSSKSHRSNLKPSFHPHKRTAIITAASLWPQGGKELICKKDQPEPSWGIMPTTHLIKRSPESFHKMQMLRPPPWSLRFYMRQDSGIYVF